MASDRANCPNCGGSLSIKGKGKICEYCGASFGDVKSSALPPVIKDAPAGETQAPPQPEPSESPAHPSGNQWSGIPQKPASGNLAAGCFKSCMTIGFIVFFLTIFFGFRFIDCDGWQEAMRDRRVERHERRQRARQEAGEERRRKAEAPFVPFLNYVKENGRLPNDVQGAALIDTKLHRDSNGSEIRYELYSRNRFALRSIGNDGFWWTRDDRVFSKVVPDDAIQSEPDSIAVDNLESAKESLASAGPFQHHVAINWLTDHWQELDRKQRQEVVEMTLAFPVPEHQPQDAHLPRARFIRSVLASVEESRQLEIAELAEKRQRPVLLSVCIEHFTENKNKSAVLEFINFSCPDSKMTIEPLIRELDIDRAAIRKQSVKDLEKPSRFVKAARRLIDDPPADELKKIEIGKTIIRSVANIQSNRSGLTEKDVERFLKGYGVKETSGDIVDWLKNDTRFADAILQHLIGLRDPETFEELVKIMCDSGALPHRTFKALQRCGTELEPALLKHLPDTSEYYQERISELLAKCGTERSLVALEKVRQEASRNETRNAAKDAMVKIHRAKRTPVDLKTKQ